MNYWRFISLFPNKNCLPTEQFSIEKQRDGLPPLEVRVRVRVIKFYFPDSQLFTTEDCMGRRYIVEIILPAKKEIAAATTPVILRIPIQIKRTRTITASSIAVETDIGPVFPPSTRVDL
jgi:hypothetical protein